MPKIWSCVGIAFLAVGLALAAGGLVLLRSNSALGVVLIAAGLFVVLRSATLIAARTDGPAGRPDPFFFPALGHRQVRGSPAYLDCSAPLATRNDVQDAATLARLLAEGRVRSPPGMAELAHENGFKLLLGISERCCVQHSSVDDQPPYLMAIVPGQRDGGDAGFMFGGSFTEILGNQTIPFETMQEVALHFFRTGERSDVVGWEEI